MLQSHRASLVRMIHKLHAEPKEDGSLGFLGGKRENTFEQLNLQLLYLTALLRYNSHTIQVSHFKYTVRWCQSIRRVCNQPLTYLTDFYRTADHNSDGSCMSLRLPYRQVSNPQEHEICLST